MLKVEFDVDVVNIEIDANSLAEAMADLDEVKCLLNERVSMGQWAEVTNGH